MAGRTAARRGGRPPPRPEARRLLWELAGALALVASLPAAATPAARAADERAPLMHVTVTEGAGAYAAAAHATFGAPFADGALSDAADLRAWDGSGRAVPSQARALSRWPSGSVAWALVDVQVELQARGSAPLVLGLAPDIAPPPDPWRLGDAGDGTRVVLEDGVTAWPLLVLDDEHGDAIAGLRGELLDRFGTAYRAEVDPPEAWTHRGPGEPVEVVGPVEFLEWGPLRVVARMRGAHRPASTGEAGLPLDFHTFTIYVHLLAGRARARVEWILENGPLEEPTGPLAFRRYALSAELGPGPHAADVPGLGAPRDAPFRLAQLGATPGRFAYVMDGREFVPARADDLAGGVLDAAGGVHVHLVESAGNHPTALGREPGGPLVLEVLAEVEGVEHFLDDATRKTFRVDVLRGLGPRAREALAAAARPPHVALDLHDVAASGAWGDTGRIQVIDRRATHRGLDPLRDAPTGWADHGEWVRNTHQSGSPRNRLSVYLEAVQAGSADLRRAADVRAWHAMDLRPYHILGFSADEHPDANLAEGTPHANEAPERRLGRDGLEERHAEWKRGLPARGHGYNGFDGEHMTLDDVYECYLLSGSWPALSALRSAGEAMLTWHWVKDWLHTARTTGWTLRALVQVFRATGDARYLRAARGMVDLLEAERGRGEVKYVHRNPPDPRHIADAESEAPWMVAVTVYGLAAYHRASGDERVPAIAADLQSLLLAAWRGNGFVSDLPVDGPLDGGEVHQPLGLSQWIPGAVAEACFLTGDFGPVRRIEPYYEQMLRHSSRPVSFGSPTWHFWQPYLEARRVLQRGR